MDKDLGYFYHGTGEFITEGITTMLQIIESGGIKSANRRQVKISTLYNGDDYVSVCRWDDALHLDGFDSLYDSAFYGWIFDCTCFIISNTIPAIKCKQVDNRYHFDNTIERVSEFKDEWHVKDEISLDEVIAISLPLTQLEKGKVTIETYDKLKRILEYASLHNWQVFNSNNQDLIKEVEKKLSISH